MTKAILLNLDDERRKKVEIMSGIDGVSMTELIKNLIDFGWDQIYQKKIQELADGQGEK